MPEHITWEWAAIVLIERDDAVAVPARTLAHLVSYALAGPSTDFSLRLRDEAVEDTRRCYLEAFKRTQIDGSDAGLVERSDPNREETVNAAWLSLADVADWLVTIGYPFDFRVDPPPPPELCQAIEEAWVRKDGTAEYDDDIRATVADEGGWLDLIEANLNDKMHAHDFLWYQ